MAINFEQIFQYLNNPYALAGFIFLLFVFIIWTLIKKKFIKGNSKAFLILIRYAFILSIIAIVAGVIMQYISTRPIKTESPVLELQQIPNLDEKIKTFFSSEITGEKVRLKFLSAKYGLDIDFDAPYNMSVRTLRDSIVSHFEFKKLLIYDSVFTAKKIDLTMQSGIIYDYVFILYLNLSEIPERKEITLKDADFKDGDRVSLRLKSSSFQLMADFGQKKNTENLRKEIENDLKDVEF
jgi:hypothetical protein